ncbi:MAG: rhodanese-like domain-containing protein [Acidobacteriaceae bacterium]
MNASHALLLLAVLFAIYLVWRRFTQIAPEHVTRHLREGAVIIDVRTSAEYRNGHLPKAINIPLNHIEITIPDRFPDRSKVLLLHCHSGARSGLAVRRLKAKGYPNAFNLGSYHRATKLTSSK